MLTTTTAAVLEGPGRPFSLEQVELDDLAVDHRLDVALELGATHRINPATEDVAKALDRITGGTGLDYAVDTTADMRVLRTAVDALGTLGRAAAVGATAPGTELVLDYQDLLVGRSVVGVTEGDADPESLIPLLAGLHRQGRLSLDKIVKTYPFSEINQAVADARDGSTIKPVLLFDAD